MSNTGVAHPNGQTYDVMPARPRRGDLVLAFFVVCGLLGAAAGLAGLHIYSIANAIGKFVPVDLGNGGLTPRAIAILRRCRSHSTVAQTSRPARHRIEGGVGGSWPG